MADMEIHAPNAPPRAGSQIVTGGLVGPLCVHRASYIAGETLVFPAYYFFFPGPDFPDPECCVEGNRIELPTSFPSIVFFKAPGIPSIARRPGPCPPSYNIFVAPDYLGSTAEEVLDFDARRLEFSREASPGTVGLDMDLRRFHDESQDDSVESHRIVECLIPLIVVSLLRCIVPEGERAPLLRFRHPGLSRSLRLIRGSFSESIPVREMAAAAGLSPSQFMAVFRRDMRCTPHEYLNRLRIQEAKRLFRKGMFVTEVAFAVGFQSLSGFEECFFRMVGVSPRVYRAAWRR